MGTKFISGVGNVQAPLIKKDTAFGSRVSGNTSMLRSDQSRHVSPTVLAVVNYLKSEGWGASVKQQCVHVVYNGGSYMLCQEKLMTCDYSDIPIALANDVMDVMKAEGHCE